LPTVCSVSVLQIDLLYIELVVVDAFDIRHLHYRSY